MLIYQEDRGADNSGKLPSGGVIAPATVASSMSVAIANPITFYDGGGLVINQAGQSNDLYNYYWTSYSRGTDGDWVSNWHNAYLDSYIPLRYKSIYDPCPYGYRIPSNGTYNQFVNTGWENYSYAGGTIWNQSWLTGTGDRRHKFYDTGAQGWYISSTIVSQSCCYILLFEQSGHTQLNRHNLPRSYASSVRCIEECEILLARIVSKIDVTAHGAV